MIAPHFESQEIQENSDNKQRAMAALGAVGRLWHVFYFAVGAERDTCMCIDDIDGIDTHVCPTTGIVPESVWGRQKNMTILQTA